MALGEALRKLRLKHGLYIKDLAELVGKSPSAISQYENNIRKPSIEFIQELVNLYGLEGDEIKEFFFSNDSQNAM